MNKFSIILPVRNGGNYVKECIHSILNQQHNDFNLVVLDNCSTDGTTEYVRSLNDPRILLIPSDRPLSIEENWARIIKVPKNEFITLIGHDDILAPDYLEVMEGMIRQYPDAALYQAHFNFIDGKGDKIKSCKPMAPVEKATDFLESFLQNKIDVMGTGFMMRASDYDRLGGIPPYPNLLFADFEIFMNLARISYKATSPKNCFSFRLHLSTTTVSPDIKMHRAFDRFVHFLHSLQQSDENLNKVITQHGIPFIAVYCKGLAHRLLRTPKEKRDQLSVKLFIQQCKSYADLLVPGNNFDPLNVPSVRMAKFIDSNAIGRKVFLLFKKVYSKPILK
jgi:glycosyltransferase involved in cell wall biosynthesis